MDGKPTGRSLLAITAIVPLVVVGLAGCQADSSDSTDKKPKSTKSKTETKKPKSTEGGGLPFPPNNPDPSEETTSEPTSAPSASPSETGGNGGGGGGTDVVKWDGTDLSHINWQVTCYLGDSPSIYGTDFDQPKDSFDGPSLMVTTDTEGKVDWILASEGSKNGTSSIYYSKSTETDSSTSVGHAEITIDGANVTVTGEAQAGIISSELVNFEFKLTCDAKY